MPANSGTSAGHGQRRRRRRPPSTWNHTPSSAATFGGAGEIVHDAEVRGARRGHDGEATPITIGVIESDRSPAANAPR